MVDTNEKASPAARAVGDALLRAAQAILPRNLCLTNTNVPDSEQIPLLATMGELRALSAALASDTGERGVVDALYAGRGYAMNVLNTERQRVTTPGHTSSSIMQCEAELDLIESVLIPLQQANGDGFWRWRDMQPGLAALRAQPAGGGERLPEHQYMDEVVEKTTAKFRALTQPQPVDSFVQLENVVRSLPPGYSFADAVECVEDFTPPESGGQGDYAAMIERHQLRADECPGQSMVVLSSSMRKLLATNPPAQASVAEDVDELALTIASQFALETNASVQTKARLQLAIIEALRHAAFAAKAGGAIECNGLDTPERVRFYEHDFYPLSNFSAFRDHHWGLPFDTSEAAYHWLKFSDTAPAVAEEIRLAPSAHEAFKIAERNKELRRKDWDAIKVSVMRGILRSKVEQHEYVRRKLLATGDRLLVEDSWRDDFWGWGPNRDGQNWLGRLWMELRAALAQGAGNER